MSIGFWYALKVVKIQSRSVYVGLICSKGYLEYVMLRYLCEF